MKKIILVGRVGSGKTSLTQALSGKKVQYHKTQYVHYGANIIDTPGEYAETREFGAALALYSYEADIVGLLLSATEPYSLFSPNITCLANREVIGIVTKIDREDATPERSANWLRLAGCEKVFFVTSRTGEEIDKLHDYLGKNDKQKTKIQG